MGYGMELGQGTTARAITGMGLIKMIKDMGTDRKSVV